MLKKSETAPRMICVCVLFSISVFGQSHSAGQVSGTVRDGQGALVANASIVLENKGNGDSRIAETDTAGSYGISLLPPGDYELTVSALGFTPARCSHLVVGVNQLTTVNVVLSVAGPSFEVKVSDTTPLINTQNPELVNEFEAHAVSALPSATRNFLQMVTLAAGVSVDLTNNSAVGRNSPNLSVNGARTEQNNLQINGVNADDLYGHDFAGVAVPAPESIQEVTVRTSMFDASLKSTGGASIQLTTKGGTDQVHGSVYGYLRDEVFNANDPNLNSVGVDRPELQRYVYGATLGGPLHKERAFYFLSYQGTHESNGATGQSIYKSVLIAPGLTDDRSEATLLYTFKPLKPDKTLATAIDPVSLALLNEKLPTGQYIIPTPQQANGRVSGTALSTYGEQQFNSNIDLVVRPRDGVAAKLFFAHAPQFLALSGDTPGGIAFGTTSLPGFGLQVINDNRVLGLSHAHIFSTRSSNKVDIGYNFLRNKASPQESVLDSSIGIQRPTATDFPGLPNIMLARDEGGASVGSAWITLNDAYTHSFSVGDILSLHRRMHHIKLGGVFRRYWWDVNANVNTYGEIDFATFNDFLIGNSDFSTIGVGINNRHFRTNNYNFFVQDDWKVSQKFTLNLGLRYELNLPPYETAGLIGGFDPTIYRPRMEVSPDGFPVGPPSAGIVMAENSQYSLPDVSKVNERVVNSVSTRNFGPRLGFAWSPFDSDRLAVRGGYGIFYSEPSFFYLAWDFFSPPFYQTFVSSGNSFANPFPDVPSQSAFPLIQKGYPLASNPFDRNLRTPYVQQFNASIEYELIPDTLLQLAYVGTRGLRLFRQVEINQARIASLNNPIKNQVTGEVITDNTNENASLRSPLQGVDSAFFVLNQSNAQSTYHSLQATLNRRLSHGLELQASYTFSKSIDDGSVPGLDTSTIVGDQASARSNRGLSDYDRTHRFVGYVTWETPTPSFAKSTRVGRVLAAPWQLSGIVTIMSGLPIDLIDPTGGSLYGLVGARPNWAAGTSAGSAQLGVPSGYFFNPAAFTSAIVEPGKPIPSSHDGTALAAAEGTDLGNVGRNVLRGPSQSNIDFSIAKQFSLEESKRLEFRADIFNILNHGNRENPISDINSGDFGKIVSFSSSPRIVQLSLKFEF
jgi:outer membrane receptor protein involved in Fe transport